MWRSKKHTCTCTFYCIFFAIVDLFIGCPMVSSFFITVSSFRSSLYYMYVCMPMQCHPRLQVISNSLDMVLAHWEASWRCTSMVPGVLCAETKSLTSQRPLWPADRWAWGLLSMWSTTQTLGKWLVDWNH